MADSDIAQIVDYTAWIAGSIQGLTLPNGEVVGVRSVYGAGQNFYPDPLRPGEMIQPIPENIEENLTHVSEAPSAPNVEPLTQDGIFHLTWTIPMKLYFPRGDLATMRQTMLPFYNGYLKAFCPYIHDPLWFLARIKSFADHDENGFWDFLLIEFEVEEDVSY